MRAHRNHFVTTIGLLTVVLLFCGEHRLAWAQAAEAESSNAKPDGKSVTAADPSIPEDQLRIALRPLEKHELEIEAAAWIGLVKAKVQEVSAAQNEVRKRNIQIEAAEEKVEQLEEKADETGAETKAGEEQAKEEAEKGEEQKSAALQAIVSLQEDQAAIIERAHVVLDAWEAKGGDPADHKLYLSVVSGIPLDASDVSALWTTTVGWLTSPEGGLKWARNIGMFIAILVAFIILSKFASRAVERALQATRRLSDLLRRFLVRMVRRAIVIVGLIVALSALGVNIGPLLAVIGAAGFVVAFALQDSLSNFASGILILFYRPFDVGDVVDTAGVLGKVNSMNLVSTTIRTPDNKTVIVPNNSIWGNVITNATANAERRVDLVFGIGYEDDIAKAQSILEEVVKEHELTLDDPEPVIQVHELADSSVNFVCRPWAKTEDYWTVYWDLTRTVKERFDEAGVSIPFPQHDVHVHNS